MDTPKKGRLFLIPNVLGDTAPLEVVPMSVKKTIESLRYFVFEKEKAGQEKLDKASAKLGEDVKKESSSEKEAE